jgi:hypothetical protein
MNGATRNEIGVHAVHSPTFADVSAASVRRETARFERST